MKQEQSVLKKIRTYRYIYESYVAKLFFASNRNGTCRRDYDRIQRAYIDTRYEVNMDISWPALYLAIWLLQASMKCEEEPLDRENNKENSTGTGISSGNTSNQKHWEGDAFDKETLYLAFIAEDV